MTAVPGLDVDGFARWLQGAHPELAAAGPLEASVIAGGKSNLTYRVDGAAVPLVVRRPPLGHVLSSAHDMRREHRVIAALAGSAVPVPAAIDLVDDTADAAVTGTPFFVMERVEGRVLNSTRLNADYEPAALRALSLELAETLADLHAVDPAAVGLEGFGRPQGFRDRQLATWRRQYAASRSRGLPALDELQERLGARLPDDDGRAGIVHGDYRLDNALVAAGPRPRIAAILDWEMATLGDPRFDLGMLGLYWHIGELPGGAELAASAVDPAAGYPSFDELVEAYAARAGTGIPDLGWFRAFAAYKLAVILEGIHVRHSAGETVGTGFDGIGAMVEPLAGEGLRQLAIRAEAI